MRAWMSRRPRSMRLLLALAFTCVVLPAPGVADEEVRVKDLGKLQGWRDNALSGYGLVTGLAGTGDSPGTQATRQALSNALSAYGLNVAPELVQSRNVAVVLVAATLPPFVREGDSLDVSVSSAGDARSLVGGTLLLTPLKGPDGRVYALASGPLSVGGYRYAANGNVMQKNHPTSGSIPNGATVEVGVEAALVRPDGHLTFLLADPDFGTASRVAEAINRALGQEVAEARDAAGIDIRAPGGPGTKLVTFVAQLETVMVKPDRRPRVVIDERTGTVVAGADVRISKVAISHGDLKVSVATRNTASQPSGVWQTGPGVRTTSVTNSRVEVAEANGPGFLEAGSDTVADLVQSLARLKTNTRDVISILRAIKAAGALHAELIIR